GVWRHNVSNEPYQSRAARLASARGRHAAAVRGRRWSRINAPRCTAAPASLRAAGRRPRRPLPSGDPTPRSLFPGTPVAVTWDPRLKSAQQRAAPPPAAAPLTETTRCRRSRRRRRRRRLRRRRRRRRRLAPCLRHRRPPSRSGASL
ncbi:hypothetical protein EMIHUDRAFT_443326, partial [Emiliania huxleyi CCMP1516]|uniref:Uncharacterized protein n=2 Tax=Emiliania huxleyi TaxID=2903 RepID=A0A0D3JTR8_EMIH1